MRPLQTDLSIYDKLNFERPPVGVKFLFFRPEGMEQLALDKNLSFCEMLKEAQETGTPFYFGKENNEACVGNGGYGTIRGKRADWGQIGNLSGTTS